jgi:hypothetical protein
MRTAFEQRDAAAVRTLLESHPAFRSRIDDPEFPFDAPALVACANNAALVDVLLDFVPIRTGAATGPCAR